jgi:hypothetical protein
MPQINWHRTSFDSTGWEPDEGLPRSPLCRIRRPQSVPRWLGYLGRASIWVMPAKSRSPACAAAGEMVSRVRKP